MRRLLCMALAMLLISGAALGEIGVEASGKEVTLGNIWEFEVTGSDMLSYQYTLLRNGKELFSGEQVPQGFGAYRPRKDGEYVLKVTAWDEKGNQEKAEASFRVTSLPKCTLQMEKASLQAGEEAVFTAQVEGGVSPFRYEYSVFRGNERIYARESMENIFSYTPGEAGEMRLLLSVTDAEGNQAAAERAFSVQEGAGVSISGGTGTFYAQGGMKKWTVHAPGIWTAETDADFIQLAQNCGENGDELMLTVEENPGLFRQGYVIIRCGAREVSFPVSQAMHHGLEEDFSLSPVTDYLFIDGKEQATWMAAEEEAVFDIAANGPWEAWSEADFLSLQPREGQLIVAAEENQGEDIRKGIIYLRCGWEMGYIFVFQPPAGEGADVQEVYLSAYEGKAYQESVTAEVMTSRNADQLILSSPAWKKALVFSSESAREIEDTLYWEVEIPLQGNGGQNVLFTAYHEGVPGERKTALLQVTGEEAGFGPGNPLLLRKETESILSVMVTASTEEISLLDPQGLEMGVFTPETAQVDHCLPGDESGRYALWEMKLSPGVTPHALRIGKTIISGIAEKREEKEFSLYSQQDGYWEDQGYRHSNLEHSGCAIFALSHALQLLGYSGENILPENLAKTYAFCLLEGGTMNSTLIGNAGNDFGFKTRYELYENKQEIISRMAQGAVYSFAVVQGHIAMVAEVSEDQSKFRIIDSAPSATFERIKNAKLYYRNEAGEFIAANTLDDIPGSRYFIEKNAYGGMEYWLDASYVVKRGVRLIMPK